MLDEFDLEAMREGQAIRKMFKETKGPRITRDKNTALQPGKEFNLLEKLNVINGQIQR